MPSSPSKIPKPGKLIPNEERPYQLKLWIPKAAFGTVKSHVDSGIIQARGRAECKVVHIPQAPNELPTFPLVFESNDLGFLVVNLKQMWASRKNVTLAWPTSDSHSFLKLLRVTADALDKALLKRYEGDSRVKFNLLPASEDCTVGSLSFAVLRITYNGAPDSRLVSAMEKLESAAVGTATPPNSAAAIARQESRSRPLPKVVRDKQNWAKKDGKYLFSDEQLNEWKSHNNKKKWPAPYHALGRDAEVLILWDLENVSLVLPHEQGLRPHDQYSLLLATFGEALGTDHVKLHVVVSKHKLNAYGPVVKSEIEQLYPKVSLRIVQGIIRKGVEGGKTEIADLALLDELNSFINRAKRGDAIVLISGDADFLSAAQSAKTKSINFYLLCPSDMDEGAVPLKGPGPLAKTSRRLYEAAHWAVPYSVFVSLHKDYLIKKRGLKLAGPPKTKATKKKDQKASTEKDREAEEKRWRIKQAKCYKQHIEDEKEQTKLDMLLIIDATSSMKPYIDRVKKAITNEMVDEINRRFPHSTGNIRYGVLGYRDIGDAKQGQRQFEKLPFTPDVEEVGNFLDKLEAVGGYDYAEDVVGAIAEAATFEWEQPNRGIFHVCDAPGHGEAFHDCGKDDDHYYSAPPPGREDPEVEARRALKMLRYPLKGPSGATGRGVQRYMFCHLNKRNCAKMTGRFKQILKEEALDNNMEGSPWMVESEVMVDLNISHGSQPSKPTKLRLDDLVGRLIGAMTATIGSSMSQATLTRVQSKRVKSKEYMTDTEATPTIPEGDEEPEPEPAPSGEVVEKAPDKERIYVWADMDSREEREKRSKDLARFKRMFRRMNNRDDCTNCQVTVSKAPAYQNFQDIMFDIDDSTETTTEVKKPTKDGQMELLIRSEVSGTGGGRAQPGSVDASDVAPRSSRWEVDQGYHVAPPPRPHLAGPRGVAGHFQGRVPGAGDGKDDRDGPCGAHGRARQAPPYEQGKAHRGAQGVQDHGAGREFGAALQEGDSGPRRRPVRGQGVQPGCGGGQGQTPGRHEGG